MSRPLPTPAAELADRLLHRTDAALLFGPVVRVALTCPDPHHALRRAAEWARAHRPRTGVVGLYALSADDLRWLTIALDGAGLLSTYLPVEALRASGEVA